MNAPAFPDLHWQTPCHPGLQRFLESLDATQRARFGMAADQTALGLLDLLQTQTAWLRPDQLEYGASVPKIGILLTWFAQHPDRAAEPGAAVRREFGLMIKQSSNELAARYSQELGLAAIRQVIESHGLYDASRGGGLWVGKHYGITGERIGDPVADHSHAATVRQALRFLLLLEQGRLVSPEASRTMREIFASPAIPHVADKFVKGLAGRDLEIRRKSGTWEDWHHDAAVIRGPGRWYILAALTRHPEGDAYLEGVAAAVDDRMLTN